MDVSQNDLYRFSPGALYALCTDVAMWNHDYIAAEKYSKMLYDLNRYTLVSGNDFVKVVSTATTIENIWTLKWSYLNNGYNRIVQNLSYGTTNAPVAKPVRDLWASPSWVADIRRAQTYDITQTYASNHLTQPLSTFSIWKYEPGQKLPTNANEKYIPLYRLADIILMRAEALNKLSRFGEALTELNKVRTRAGLIGRIEADYITAPDKTLAIENDILQERQFELFGEGKRWFDLVRTGRAITTMNNYFDNYQKVYGVTTYTKFTDVWQLYWPVLQDNIIENGNLTQTGLY
jgi:hypothetical protein